MKLNGTSHIERHSESVFVLKNPWDLREGKELDELLDIINEEWPSAVLVDFTDAEDLGPKLIEKLMGIHYAISLLGGKLILFGVAPSIRRLLAARGVIQLLQLAPDWKTALSWVRGTSGD